MSDFDFSKIIDHKFYDLTKPIQRLVCRLNFKTQYRGTENIPAEGPFIIACNHFNYYDPLMVALGIKDRQIHFMAKTEIFENPLAAKIFENLNAFPVNRGKADIKAIKYSCEILKSGRILGIFPEGTRSKTGDIGEAKKGVINIAAKTKCNILPVSLYNEDKLKRGSLVTVRFGEIIRYESLNLPSRPSKEDVDNAADMLMDIITNLQAQGHK